VPENRDLPTARWEHRIGARRELDHNNFLRDFYRISCECSLELFGDLAELPVSNIDAEAVRLSASIITAIATGNLRIIFCFPSEFQ
jgi:hypothetical protein